MKKSMLITREQFLNFIKKKDEQENSLSRSTQHYLAYFDCYQKTGKKESWNWTSFSVIWFFYRRMYSNGFYLILIISLVFKMEKKLFPKIFSEFWGDIIAIILSTMILAVFCMMYGDYIYLKHANTEINKGILKSGTSKTALFITLTLFISLMILLIFKAMNPPPQG